MEVNRSCHSLFCQVARSELEAVVALEALVIRNLMEAKLPYEAFDRKYGLGVKYKV
jgi:hypothetical protein